MLSAVIREYGCAFLNECYVPCLYCIFLFLMLWHIIWIYYFYFVINLLKVCDILIKFVIILVIFKNRRDFDARACSLLAFFLTTGPPFFLNNSVCIHEVGFVTGVCSNIVCYILPSFFLVILIIRTLHCFQNLVYRLLS